MREVWYKGLQRFCSRHKWLHFACVAFAEYSIFLYACFFVWLLFIPYGYKLAIGAVFAMALARFGFTQLIYFLMPAPRPYQVYKLHPPFSRLFSWQHSAHDSFPSGHTAALTAFSIFVFAFLPGWGLVGIVLALLTGFARVVTGFHFLLDIFAGLIYGAVGALWVLLLYLFIFT